MRKKPFNIHKVKCPICNEYLQCYTDDFWNIYTCENNCEFGFGFWSELGESFKWFLFIIFMFIFYLILFPIGVAIWIKDRITKEVQK